jgi:hypothetical protein
MNNLYFGCIRCRVFVDAGYRHAYAALEQPGIVKRSAPVDVDAVLQAREYWDVDAEWLRQLLPAVRQFLHVHRDHEVQFGEGEGLGITPMYDRDYRLFEWLMEAGYVYEELPRYYVERLGFRRWSQVVEHIERSQSCPWWWHDDEYTNAARQKFLTLVSDDGTEDAARALPSPDS